MSRPANPPVFPTPTDVCCVPGISLLDLFAAAAMHALCAGPQSQFDPELDDPNKMADEAYALAEAMLRARAAGQT